MRKTSSFLLIILSLLTFKNFAFAQPEVDACKNFFKAGDYRRAIEAGKVAVEKYPNSSDAHLCLGLSYNSMGEFKLAIEHAKKAASLTSDKKSLIGIYAWIGVMYKGIGDLDNALLYYSKSLSIAKDLGDRKNQAYYSWDIARIYKDKGEFDKALGYYEEFLRLETNDGVKIVIYENIASIYEEIGNYQKAAEYLQKAMEISERYGDYHGASLTKLNIGDTYRKMKDYEKAEKYIREGLEGVKGNKNWEATGYRYLGLLYIDKGDYKTAKDYLTLAYNLFKSTKAWSDANTVLSDIQKLEILSDTQKPEKKK
jgi:tetratricopeptide (TPR) repeat protein